MPNYAATAVLDRMPTKEAQDASKGALYKAIVEAVNDPENEGKILKFNASRIGRKTTTALLEVGIVARTVNGFVHAGKREDTFAAN